MLSKKENFLETIRPGGKPDRLIKQFEGTVFLPGDPVNNFVRGERFPGMPPKQDLWGTTIVWEPGTPGAMPHVTELNKVVKDVTNWRSFTKVPDLIANCRDMALWEPYLERAAAIHVAVTEARPGDVVLVAGKGHEDYQIFADRTIHFDDHEQVRNAFADRALADS